MKKPALAVDPYQVLFPIGILHALVGAALWVFFALGKIPFPMLPHAHYMVGGFLISFAAGFMLTAVPRFTGAPPCSRIELVVVSSLAAASIFVPRSATTLALLLFLTVFFIRRMAKRSFSPPPHFIFLPIGLLFGIVGAMLMILFEAGLLDAAYLAAGRLFLYYGTMLFLVLGIGSRLIAALLGWEEPPNVQIEPLNQLGRSRRLTEITAVAQAFLLITGFVLEALGLVAAGRLVRAACATWIAMERWKLYRRPQQPGRLARWLWVSSWALLIGLWMPALFPALGVHAAHLTFIAGFGLMALLVASRVTLAHGGYDLALEVRSKIFPIVGVMICLAALTRAIAPWTQSYLLHLASAALLWNVAIVSWAIFFIPRMLPRAKNSSLV